MGTTPPSNQHYYDFSRLPDGMGPVIDILGVSTAAPVNVVVELAPGGVDMAGVYVYQIKPSCYFCSLEAMQSLLERVAWVLAWYFDPTGTAQ